MKEPFYKTEDGKIINYTIHETNSGVCYIRTSLSMIKLLKEKGELTDEELNKRIERIEDGCKKIRDITDYLYTKFKEKYESTTN